MILEDLAPSQDGVLIGDIAVMAALSMQGIRPTSYTFGLRGHVTARYDDSADVRRIVKSYADGSLVGSLKEHADGTRQLVRFIRQHQQGRQ